MKIEHVAIWAKDIDKICDFYHKYFDGVVHPVYHNPAKQFTSRFVTFESGARLEVMHRPDVGTVTSLQSYTHRSANEKMRAFFRFLTSAVFHVEHCGLTHLSFSVGSKEGVDRLTQKMSDDGIQIVGQPRTTGDGYYESVVLDPEGNRVEVTV